MAMRIPAVFRGATFDDDLSIVRQKYPEIDAIVAEFTEVLIHSWSIPHRPIGGETPDLYAVRLDYPPHGSAGIGLFLATYHATAEAHNKMNDPLRRYTLLTLVERANPS